MKKKAKLLIFLILVLGLFSIYYFDLYLYLRLEKIKFYLTQMQAYYSVNEFVSLVAFFTVYVIAVAFSIPGATVLTLLAGALFGLKIGLVMVSFASSVGATLAFLVARYLLRDFFEEKFSSKFKLINNEFNKNGAFYLFSLRLIPIFPFFMINILMGLTRIKVRTFYWVSQIGMLAGTFVYVQAGQQLAKIDSLSDISNPQLIFSFALLGLLPWILKMLLQFIENKKIYSEFARPKKYDYNTIVIGAGAAGLVSSYITSAVKAKVALIESNKMGGDCLNYGCVPSKALIKSAKVAHTIKNSTKYGISSTTSSIQFSEVMNRIQSVIHQVEPHDSVERYSQLGVDCIKGQAQILSPFTIEVNGTLLNTRNIIIAAGAEPIVPSLKNIEKLNYLTSENLWRLKELPQHLLIVGGGAIGCELAQSFQRLGSQVTLIERNDRLLNRSDLQASEFIKNHLVTEGVTVLNQTEIIDIIDEKTVQIKMGSETKKLHFSHILFALGRRARSHQTGFEKLKLELNENQTIKHNEFMQTKYPNVFVCGDVAGPIQLTHVAAHQAWYASVNALFRPFKMFKIDYDYIPNVIFTDPEVAQVGLTAFEAQEKNRPFNETKYDLNDLDRAICESEDRGFIKILTTPNQDKIIGATIVGSHAGELIAEITLAMRHGIGLNKILSTVHSYPTWSEALKMTAGHWRQKNKPDQLLLWVEKFHNWRRT